MSPLAGLARARLRRPTVDRRRPAPADPDVLGRRIGTVLVAQGLITTEPSVPEL